MRLFRQGIVGVLCAVAGLGAVAGPASAAITTKGIGGVNIGMAQSRVDKVVGPPADVGELSGYERRVYTKKKLDVLFEANKVIRVRTRSRSERTAEGAHPGMKESEARRRLRGEACNTVERNHVCFFSRGRSVFAFVFARGRMTYAEVSKG